MKIAALAAALVASPAFAAMESYDLNYGPISVNTANGVIGQLPLFDTQGGTRQLTKVTLTLMSNTSSGTIAWDNEAEGNSSEVTLGIGAEVTASAQGLLGATAIPLQTGTTTVDADNDGAADFIGTDAFTVTGGSGTDSDMDMSTAPATLTAFEFDGAGTFDVSLGSTIETFLSTSGGFGPIDPIPGITDGKVTVTYEYIPSPATAALLGLGGLAATRRRR